MAGSHEDLTREMEPASSSDRSFGLVFAGVFTVVTVWPLIHHRPARLWALAPAALFLLAALVSPGILAPLNFVWTKFGLLLQKIVHPIVMGVMFYVVFMPAGWLLRLAGKDLLRLKYEPALDSYWIQRVPPGPDGPSMARQF